MAGIKTGNPTGEDQQFGSMRGTLKFRATDTIDQPKNITLDGEFLTWTAWCSQGTGHLFNFDGKPVEGCLDDFLSLTTATPNEVLAFVNRRGVLGIEPVVLGAVLDPVGPGGKVATGTVITSYKEPVEIYRAFAKVAKMCVDNAYALRRNLPLDPAAIEGCGYEKSEGPIPSHAFRKTLYQYMSGIAHAWWKCATIQLDMLNTPLFDTPIERQSIPITDIIFPLHFGDWGDGQQWDRGNIFQGECLCDWLEHIKQQASRTPNPTRLQRPSPLYNVLAFQLLAAVNLPAGQYFCSECGKLFDPDPNRNKPRKDKNTYCTEGCRHEAELRLDRERKRRANTVKKMIKANQDLSGMSRP